MIKNKLKLGYLIVAVLAMAVGMGGVASATNPNLTFNSNYTVDLSAPDVNLTIASGSVADSLIVGTGDVQVIVGNGDVFTITSVDRVFDVTGRTSANVANTCAAGAGKVIVTGGSLGETITIAPTANTCAPDVEDTGGGGGGGGGGGSDTTPSTTTPAPSKPISEMTIPELQTELARLTALLAQLQAAAGGPAAPAEAAVCSAAFNTNLAYGMVSNEVRRMQAFMISKGHLAAGYNTGNYYTLTANAVGAYQTSKSISPVPNSFGPLTRAAANADCGL